MGIFRRIGTKKGKKDFELDFDSKINNLPKANFSTDFQLLSHVKNHQDKKKNSHN